MRKLILSLCLLASGASSWGAITATAVWEVRTNGSDTNGGFFKPGATGTDYSQQDTAQWAVTDAVTAGTTTITSATATFTSAIVGNGCYVTGGTGSITAAWYEVTSFTNSTTIVVDRSTGLSTGTGATLNCGGALASPSIAAANKTAGNDVYIKSGTYTLSSTTTSASNGVILDSTGGASATNMSIWSGYNSTRGDDGAKPLLQRSGISSVSLFKVTGNNTMVRNLEFDGTSGTAIKCVEETGQVVHNYRLKASNCTNRAFDFSMVNWGWATTIEATGTGGSNAAVFMTTYVFGYNISSHDNTVSGFLLGYNSSCSNCFSYRNTGATSDGFAANSITIMVRNSVAAYNGRSGFNINGAAGQQTQLINVISYGNPTGFLSDQVQDGTYLFNCGVGNSSTTNYNATNLTHLSGMVTLTADPFVSVSSSANGAANFALNTTAGGGAALRAAGFVGSSPSGASTGYQDIGPVQHADPISTIQYGYTWIQ